MKCIYYSDMHGNKGSVL